jgi:dihydroorotase
MRLMAPTEAVKVVEANREVIIGIKVRVGKHASGDSGIAPLDIALQVAEQTGLPIMAHIDEPPPSYDEVLARLRKGDVLTHAFRPFPNSPLAGDGKIRSGVLDARARGVIFDIGHGMGSLSFDTARAMLEQGFAPDTISSDVHFLNISGPVFDQAVTLSKFLALGMSLGDVITATTSAPASALRRTDLGTLAPGAAADATIFRVERGEFPMVDSTGVEITGRQLIRPSARVMSGRYTDTL